MGRYAIATVTWLILGVCIYAVGDRVVTRTRGYASLLNVAGRQRMLTQRVVMYLHTSLEQQTSETAAVPLQRAEAAVQETARGLQILQQLRDNKAPPPYTSLEYSSHTQDLFDGTDGVEALSQNFLEEARTCLRSCTVPKAIALRESVQGKVVPQLDAFVHALQVDAEDNIARMEQLGFIVSCIFALTLFLQGRMVFGPLINSLRNALQEQQRTNEEQLTAQRDLQESKEYARAVAACVTDAFIVLHNGKIVDANENFAQQFGYTAAEVKELDPGMVVSEPYREIARERWRKNIGTPLEFVAQRKDGTTIPMLANAQHYQLANGKSVRITALHDLSAQKAAEASQQKAVEAAQAAAQSRLDFLANMSHEIRTPLNGIIGMTDLMFETPLTEQQRHYADIVRVSSNHLLSLINDVLDLAKIESGKLELENAHIDVRMLVESQVEIFLGRSREKSIDLQMFVDPRLPPILMGDSGRINQILLNYINNAIKFTDKGRIIVRAELQDRSDTSSSVLFSVVDTGIGIPAEVCERLFLPFVQADATTARRFGGTGLGLSICKQLAHLMGGEVGVESAPGQGSTFWFKVRLQHDSSAALRDSMYAESVSGLRVLVVDDDTVSREIIEQYLRAWDISAISFPSGDKACAWAREGSSLVDLALIDLHMAGMDGVATSEALQPLLGHSVPHVLITAHDRPGQVQTAHNQGFAGYLTKPIRQSQLLDCIINTRLCRVPAPRTATVADVEIPGGLRRRVLVAEDNTVNQLLVLTHLRRLGYVAQAVSNGREVLTALQLGPWDLVLMDCQMPEMDGYETTQMIRTQEGSSASQRIPIVALTANAMQEDRNRCIQAGMDDYITKPVRRDALRLTLERWLGNADGVGK